MKRLTDKERSKIIVKGLDSFQGNVLISDKDANIIFANKYLCELYNLTYEEAVNMKISDLVKRGILDKSAAWGAFTTKKITMGKFLVNSGEVIDGVGYPLYDENGDFIGTAAYSYDRRFMREFMKRIAEEQIKAEKYKETVQYLSGTDSVSAVSDEKMKNIYKEAEIAAKSDGTIVIYGDSGTGKEVLANFIHNNSSRYGEAFIPVNCGAIPGELLEAEFFGYSRGAFTGADRNGKMGLFELADKGTIFLDEIGDLPISMQSKLLRVLESGEIRRLGDINSKHVNVRIIAATNKNLKDMVDSGLFRADLFYRISVIPFNIPPLRERPKDIEMLANMFAERYSRKYKKRFVIDDKLMDRFRTYSWPGNVRELRNEIERMVIYSSYDGNVYIDSDRFKTDSNMDETGLKERVDRFEKEIIMQTLRETNGKVSEAAQKLNIHRTLLYKKIKKYNIAL